MPGQKRKKAKKLNIKKGDPYYKYHKYLDFRAIIPAVIIAFISSAITAFYFMDSFVVAFENNLVTMFAVPTAVAAGIIFSLVSKIAFFTIEFIVIFLAVYAVLWIIFWEQDKKLMMKYKKKGLLKKK